MSQQTQPPISRLHELGSFLRTRRARIAPEDVGLPRGARRKTPGLRRAEVAQLVGVSVDWYTWLEQGRPIRASTQILERLAQALRMSADERTHLFLLAQQQPPPTQEQQDEAITPALQRFLDGFAERPAFVSGRRWDILAWNDAGCALFGEYQQRRGRERNTIWNIFTQPLSRQFIVGWEEDARMLLAQFRTSCARHPDDAQLAALVRDLQERSPEFRAWWPDHEVRGGQEGRKLIDHPDAGYMAFERLTFQVFDTPDLKVTVYTPLGEHHTPRKLAQLIERRRQRLGGPAPTLGGDAVGLWLAACCARAEGAWVANSVAMASYRRWCASSGCAPISAKALAQALAAHGFTTGVNRRVSDELGRQRMARGVRDLALR